MGEGMRKEPESGLRLNGSTETEIAEHFQEFLKSWKRKKGITTATLEIKKYEGAFFNHFLYFFTIR